MADSNMKEKSKSPYQIEFDPEQKAIWDTKEADGHFKENKQAEAEDPYPKNVTVIMPIRNEEKTIEKGLKAVLNQDYSASCLEIIVADGESTDGTRTVVQKYQARYPNLKLINNPGRIVPTGLNAALKQAKGDIIIRVDGHTVIAHDYVKNCVKALQNKNVENVGGKMTAAGDTNFGHAVAVATSSPFGIGNSRFHYSTQNEIVDSVYMGAWPRNVFDQIGFFDEELVRNQDDEFNYRLRANGGRILLSQDIRSEYTVRSKPKTLFRQYFQYGFWKVRVLQKHPRQMSLRQFVPPAFVAALVLLSLFSTFSPLARLLLGLTMGAYLIANVSATLLTSRQDNWRYTRYLPVAFSTIHIAYGAGFLCGLVKFASRWRTGSYHG